MIRRDIPVVLEIAAQRESTQMSEEELLTLLRDRNVIGMVAEYGDLIVGYMVYKLHKKKIEILKFASDKQHARLGIGRAMMRKLMDKLSSDRRSLLEIIVPETALDFQCFARTIGLKATLVRDHFEKEDGYCFAYSACSTAGNGAVGAGQTRPGIDQRNVV